MSQDLHVHHQREGEEWRNRTGIFVRAVLQTGHYVNADIAQLTPRSLLQWLRSRGGDNKWAEQTVMILLGWRYDDE